MLCASVAGEQSFSKRVIGFLEAPCSLSGIVSREPTVWRTDSSSRAGSCLSSSEPTVLPMRVKTEDSYRVLTTLRNRTKLKSLLRDILGKSSPLSLLVVHRYGRSIITPV